MRRLPGLSGWLARPVARALVLVLSVTTLGPLIHDLHDAACEPPLVLHDASQHRFSGVVPDAGGSGTPQHCLACHLQRVVRGHAVVKSPAPQALDPGVVLQLVDRTFVADAAAAPLPARAPPPLV